MGIDLFDNEMLEFVECSADKLSGYSQPVKSTRIFIPGNVCSSKNSKRAFRSKSTGKILVLNSLPVEKYKKQSEQHWKNNLETFLKMAKGKSFPLKVEFRFIREAKRSFDFVNLLQLPLDLMILHGYISDDSYKFIVPVINPNVDFDKKRPGLEIKVL